MTRATCAQASPPPGGTGESDRPARRVLLIEQRCDKRYNLAATLDPGALMTDAEHRSVALRPVGGPARHDAQAHEARQYFSEGKERSIRLLREAICTLEGEIADAQPVRRGGAAINSHC